MKEYLPQTLEQLQLAFEKADQADGRLREMVASPLTAINSPVLEKMELDLDSSAGEHMIDLALEIGIKRRKIVGQIQQKTQPFLTELREKLEERIRAKRVEDLPNKLSQLRQLVEGGFQYERELKEGEIFLASLRGAPAEVEPAVEVRPMLVFVEDAGHIEFDGQTIQLNPFSLKVLKVLAENLGRQVLSRKLSEQALDEANTTKSGLRVFINRLQGKINQGGQEFLISSGRKGSSSGYILRGVEVVWSKIPTVIPKEVPVVVEGKGQDVLAKLQELGVPQRGFYTIEDLAGVVRIPDLAFLRSRVSRALKKDPTIKSERFEGRRLHFRPDDFLKLIEAVRGPRRARGKKGRERTVVESKLPIVLPPRGQEFTIDRPLVLGELKVDLTLAILPHFLRSSWNMLTQTPAGIIQNCLPSGVDFNKVINGKSPEDIANFLATSFIETVERLWEKNSGSSAKETKIINECQTIKQWRIDVSVVIRKFCTHFNLPIPEKYGNSQAGQEETERRLTGSTRRDDQGAAFTGDGQLDVAAPSFGKRNRRRRRGPKYPQDGRGLITVILPILARRAAEASSIGNREPDEVGRNGGQKESPIITRATVKLEEEFGEITDGELQAISLFLGDVTVPIDEIIKIVKPFGLNLKRPEAYRLLSSTVQLTYRRKMGSWATAKELQLWGRIKEFVKEKDDNLALRGFRSRLKEWYRQQREQVVADQILEEESHLTEGLQEEVFVEEETRKGLGFFRRFFSRR